MANGRMLNKTITTDDRLNTLSQEAMLMYLMSIPHLDRDGLIDGRPRVLWGTVALLRMDLMDRASSIIQEWVDTGLAQRYNGDRTPVLWFTGFQKNQNLMRYDREPPSRFAPPPGYYRTKTDGLRRIGSDSDDFADEYEESGKLPDLNRTLTGKLPAEVEVEVEVEEEDQEGEAAALPPTHPPAPAPAVDVALDGGPVTEKPDPSTVKAITKHPAIAAYRETFLSFPSKALMVQILNHGIDDLPRWSQAVTAWCQRGYNPLNIGGMLEWYDNPERITDRLGSFNATNTTRGTDGSRTKNTTSPTGRGAQPDRRPAWANYQPTEFDPILAAELNGDAPYAA